jgi:hypothetical protein
MAKATPQQPSPPNSAPIRKARSLKHSPPKDNRIHWVCFEGKWMRAWDYSGVDDELIRGWAKLDAAQFPVKRGRPLNRERLERIQKRLDQGWKPWRIACEEAGTDATPSERRAAYSRVLNFIKHNKLKRRVILPDTRKSPTIT